MFGKKKKNKNLFGCNVEPSCAYCLHNGAAPGESVICTLRLERKNGKCRKYQYDPLQRQPRVAPPLRGKFSEEDFKL